MKTRQRILTWLFEGISKANWSPKKTKRPLELKGLAARQIDNSLNPSLLFLASFPSSFTSGYQIRRDFLGKSSQASHLNRWYRCQVCDEIFFRDARTDVSLKENAW